MSDVVKLQMWTPAREAQQYEVEIPKTEWDQWVEGLYLVRREPDGMIDVGGWFRDVELIDPAGSFVKGFRYTVDEVEV